MPILLFAICIIASSIGAIVGAGGGVIIKPVMDMFGLLPVSTVSFCSGCTVLGMSVCSLIRTRHDNVRLEVRSSTSLAIGSVAGGFAGKMMFELVRASFGNENVLGLIQAIVLTIITFCIFLYICNKDKLPTKQVKNVGAALIIGILLGIISSFLGIGGGTSNVAVLMFFFSMDAREAAKNSLYIIVFSQIASIVTAVVSHSVPDFAALDLLCMIAGGVGGALIGAKLSRQIDNKGIEKILKAFLLVIVAIDFYNAVKFAIAVI